MPKPFVYKMGQRVTLTALVIGSLDTGRPVLDIGGEAVSLPQLALDKADVRPDSARERTAEEIDLERLKDAQDTAAVARAEKEAAADRQRVEDGRKLVEAGNRAERERQAAARPQTTPQSKREAATEAQSIKAGDKLAGELDAKAKAQQAP